MELNDILVAMTNVAMTIPYMFIALAFPAFKKKDIVKPFEVFKTQGSANIWTVVVVITVGFANLFCIIQPAIDGDMPTTIYSVAGPVIFSVIAILMYWLYDRKVEMQNR